MVMQQLLFKNMQKCTYACGGWIIFTEKCTPAVTSLAIKVIAFFVSKMKRPNIQVTIKLTMLGMVST